MAGLLPGRTVAPERPSIKPVDDAIVEATLPHLSLIVANMVRLQLLTAMRPGEVCVVRPRDVDRSGDVWQFQPHKHKGTWKGRERIICIGPQAQEILRPYLERDPESYCFSPRESRLWWRAKRRIERVTAVQPSQLDRSMAKPTRQPGSKFSTQSYQKAISRACVRHGIPHWAPNQLRHSAATKIRNQFGLEAAQAILGHSRADVTQVYAERNNRVGLEVLKQIG